MDAWRYRSNPCTLDCPHLNLLDQALQGTLSRDVVGHYGDNVVWTQGGGPLAHNPNIDDATAIVLGTIKSRNRCDAALG